MSIIHFLLAIFMNCPPLMNFSKDHHQLMPTTPIRLTGGNSYSWQVNVPFNALQQCMPPYPGNNANAYGLEFRLPRDGGHCDDGILICYASTLGTTSHGFVMSDQYRIPNNERTLFVEECKSLVVKKTTAARLSHWRGIKVYTMPPPINGTRTHQLMLEASIASSPYNFGDAHRIAVHFGDQDHLFTYATIENGQQAYADDELLREAFLEKVMHGARLKNYAGLWVLGMDMLPWTKQNKLELYINRSCTCTMEAWFIQPTDSVAQIVAPKVPITGSTKCPALNTNNTFTIVLVKDAAGQAIVIDALTDAHLTNIAVELAKADENNVTGGAALMNFSIGTTDDLKVFIADTGSYVIKDERLPNGSYKMRMEIILFDHFYAIKLNGAQLGGIFLSKHWFHGVEWAKVASIKLKLNGQLMLFDEPKAIDDVKKIFETPLAPRSLKPIELIGGLLKNSTFLFRFQLLANQYFEIMFSNEAKFDESSPEATAFIVSVNRNRTVYTNVTLKVFHNEQWHKEDGRSAENLIFGDAYEVRIKVPNLFFYHIQINNQTLFGDYSNSMPFCYIKNVTVQGNATLLENPVYHKPEKSESPFSAKRLGNQMLNYGDIIVLRGKLKNGIKFFQIYLNHQFEECSKVWDDVASLYFKVRQEEAFEVTTQDPILTMTYCAHRLYKEGVWTPRIISEPSFEIVPFIEMELAILLADDGFYALYFAGLWYPICPYYTPKNKSISTLSVPPWAIDHIISDTLYDAEIRVMTASSTPEHWKKVDANNMKKRVQYTQIVETDTTRQQVDYVVLVNMTLQQQHFDEDSEVRINFFNKALEFHDLFGTTVMRLKLTLQNGTLSFNSFIVYYYYQNKEWTVKEQDKNYTFTMFEKLTDETDNNTTDFFKKFTTTDLINQSSINITTTDQSSINITTTDRIELIPTNLSFQIHITKSGFRVKLNDKGMDVNEQMLNYPAKVPAHDIQYITVEHNNITLANGTAVEVSCEPEANCINKR